MLGRWRRSLIEETGQAGAAYWWGCEVAEILCRQFLSSQVVAHGHTPFSIISARILAPRVSISFVSFAKSSATN